MTADAFAPIAGALIDAPCAWQTPGQIATSLGWDLHVTEQHLCDLITQGLIDPWPDCPAGFAVTLSALAAGRLGLTLAATVSAEIYRWSYESATARSRRAPSRADVEKTHRHDCLMNKIPDPRVADLAGDLDRAARQATARPGRPPRVEDLPKPTVLLWGHALWPWYCDEPKRARVRARCKACEPGPRTKRGKGKVPAPCRPCGFGMRPRPRLDVCPGCRDRPLMRHMYCLRCHRWGWDGVARRLAQSQARKPKRKVG